MATEKDTTFESNANTLNNEYQPTEGDFEERQFVGQFDQKYDWRFLKNIESVITHQMTTTTDSTLDPNNLLGPTIDTERLIGDGIFYNALFLFSIIEMGVSWNDIPASDVEYQIVKYAPGEDVSAGTAISWRHLPKSGVLSGVPITDTPIIPSTTGQGIPAEDEVNIYEPVGDNVNYTLARCDRLGIKLINPPEDIKDLSPITFTFRIRHQKL